MHKVVKAKVRSGITAFHEYVCEMWKVLVAYFKDVSSPAAIQGVQDAAVSTRGHGHLLPALCCTDMVLMKSGKIR